MNPFVFLLIAQKSELNLVADDALLRTIDPPFPSGNLLYAAWPQLPPLL